MKLAHDDRRPDATRQVMGGGGSLEYLVCALEHENGIGDLEGGAKLDAHDLHNVGLGQQQEGLPVNHLGRRRHNSGDATGWMGPEIISIVCQGYSCVIKSKPKHLYNKIDNQRCSLDSMDISDTLLCIVSLKMNCISKQ